MSRDRIALLAVVTSLVVLPLALDALRARAHVSWRETQAYEGGYYLPPREWLPALSLGWREALADLVWMRALIYYGDEMHHGGDVRFAYEYAEAIEALDPDFVAVYRWVGMAGLYRPTAITADDVERAVTIMQRGAERHPLDGQLAWDLGAVLVFELPPLLEDTEAADAARARGVPFLVRASRLGAAPEWASLSNAALLARIGRTDQAARLLEDLYAHTDDLATRERIAMRIRQMRDEAQAEAFLARMEELEQERRRAFPYTPAGLYLLIGPRPAADLVTPIRDGFPRAFAAGP
ncbi:MAG: hypothetical protein KF729_07405 [Sandaracinaceae bacterium]|nr:hypothetical protein [Sandaracinaceae bacterium]